MIKKRILCFDNWLLGLHNFERFAAFFEKEEFEVVLIHLGNWFNYADIAADQKFLHIKIIDICDLSTRDPVEIIKIMSPNLILLTQNNTFYNKSIIVASRLMSVPTVFMAHGLMTTAFSNNLGAPRSSIFTKIKNLTNRVRKRNLLSELFWYLSVHKRVSWLNLLQTLAQLKNRLRYDNYASNDTITNYFIVYSKADSEFCSKYFGINPNLIEVVGIPELERMQALIPNVNAFRRRASGIKPFVIYIESKVLSKKFLNNTDKFLAYLQGLQQRYSAYGFGLKFDLHPNTINDLGDNIDFIADNLVSNDSIMIYKDASFFLCDHTTKAVLAAYLSKPILLNLELYSEQDFAHFFLDYPLAFTSFDSLIESGILDHSLGATHNEPQALLAWKDWYITQFEDGLSVGERIKRHIQQLLSGELVKN